MIKIGKGLKLVTVLALVLVFVVSGCAPAPAPQPAATTAPQAPAAAPAQVTASDAKIQLTISTWGAGYIDLMNKAVLPEMQKLYPNISFVYDEGGASARYNKLLANKDNPVHDIFICSPEQNYGGIATGFLQPFNPKNVPNAAAAVADWAKPINNSGVPWSGYALGVGYNPDFFTDGAPTSWKDLWNPKAQGKLGLPAIGHSHMPPFISKINQINGGTDANIKPALDKLALLKPVSQTVTWTQWAPLYDSKDQILMADFDYYFVLLRRQGKNPMWIIPAEGALGTTTNAAVVKGTKYPDVAEAFLNVFLSEVVQKQVPLLIGQTPARLGVAIPDDMKDQGLVLNPSKVEWSSPEHSFSVRPNWTEQMNAVVAPAWGK